MHVHFKFEACIDSDCGWNDMDSAFFETALTELKYSVANYFVFPLIVRVLFIKGFVNNLVCLEFVHHSNEFVALRKFVWPRDEYSSVNASWLYEDVARVLCPPHLGFFCGHRLEFGELSRKTCPGRHRPGVLCLRWYNVVRAFCFPTWTDSANVPRSYFVGNSKLWRREFFFQVLFCIYYTWHGKSSWEKCEGRIFPPVRRYAFS